MSELEKEVKELCEEYKKRFGLKPDPFNVFFGYQPREDLKNEKKWLEISLKEGIPLFDIVETWDIFMRVI